jgi:hypothetical protein
MKLKKYLIPTLLALSGSALAADFTITANLNSGTSITDQDDGNKTVTLTPGTAVSDQLVTNLEISCNSSSGYQIKLRSLNQSNLEDASSNQIVYNFKYNNTVVDLSGTLDVVVEDTAAATTGAENRSLHISVGAVALDGKPSGTYTDTITFSIVAK